MTRVARLTAILSTVVLAAGCGRGGGGGEQGAQRPVSSAEPAAQAYTYPAPVTGHYEEANLGSYDFVDGIAYTAGAETSLYFTSDPIASPALAASQCPMTEARFLTVLRDSAWLEVSPNDKNRAKYFSAGLPFGGSGREEDVGGRYWSITRTSQPGAAHIAGAIAYGGRGEIRFDLPVAKPAVEELRESDKMGGNRYAASQPAPSQDQVLAAYQAVRIAALKKDLKALLAAQGFAADASAKIRGLAGIAEDLARFSDRFLETDATGEMDLQTGFGSVVAEGANAKGQKFFNYYTFTTCGPARLVLSSIAENPQ